MADLGNIGPYELREELGRGGMAIVWRAWDPMLHVEVAIKEPCFNDNLTSTMRQELERRFVKEARAAAKLTHPNIVAVRTAGVYDGRLAIAMELVEGMTLRRLLRESGSLSPNDTLRILNNILDGIGHAHSCGVVHRDLKPENIFITDDFIAKIGDFGIAHNDDCATSLATRTMPVFGTPAYMSPEQVCPEQPNRVHVDPRSDLFSVGVMAYEMLTGINPFKFDNPPIDAVLYRIKHEPVRNVADVAQIDLPKGLADGIMAALSKNPEERPPSAEAMKAMLHGKTGCDGKFSHASANEVDQGKIHLEPTKVLPNGMFSGNGSEDHISNKQKKQPSSLRYALAGFAAVVLAFLVVLAVINGVSAIRRIGNGTESNASVVSSSTSASPKALTVSSLVEMPDVTNMSKEAAKATIEGAGLVAIEGTGGYSSTISKGNVINQTPPAGVQVETGTQVEYRLSLGTANSTASLEFARATASSTLPGDEDSSYYGPNNAMDGYYSTAWNEGDEGDGVGEWIRFEFNTTQTVKGINIVGGFPKYKESGVDIYLQNTRPKEICITFSDGKSENFTLLDKRGESQRLDFAISHKTTCIIITIKSVYAGTIYNDCCIAEVNAF